MVSGFEVPKLFMSGMFCMSCDVAEIYDEAFRPMTMHTATANFRSVRKRFPPMVPS